MSFQEKLNFGKKYQEISKQFLPKDEIVLEEPDGLFKPYDYKTNLFKYEIKSDRMGYKYGCKTWFIEFECNKQNSGINSTESDYYFYFFHKPDNTYETYEIPTSWLKNACKGCRQISGGDGQRVKGYIVPVNYEFKL
jgi:hypothetical protein